MHKIDYLTPERKARILEVYAQMPHMKNGRLAYGALQALTDRFGVSKGTIKRLVQEANNGTTGVPLH